MAADDKIIITAEQAEGLLLSGPLVHTYLDSSIALIGADWDRDFALDVIQKAKSIEIGGERCKEYKHALVVYDGDRYVFIETDMAKVAELEDQLRASHEG